MKEIPPAAVKDLIALGWPIQMQVQTIRGRACFSLKHCSSGLYDLGWTNSKT